MSTRPGSDSSDSDEERDEKDEKDSEYSDSDSSEVRDVVQSDLEFLRSTKTVASKLHIFNQLVNQTPNPPSFRQVQAAPRPLFGRQDEFSHSSAARSFFQTQVQQQGGVRAPVPIERPLSARNPASPRRVFAPANPVVRKGSPAKTDTSQGPSENTKPKGERSLARSNPAQQENSSDAPRRVFPKNSSPEGPVEELPPKRGFTRSPPQAASEASALPTKTPENLPTPEEPPAKRVFVRNVPPADPGVAGDKAPTVAAPGPDDHQSLEYLPNKGGEPLRRKFTRDTAPAGAVVDTQHPPPDPVGDTPAEGGLPPPRRQFQKTVDPELQTPTPEKPVRRQFSRGASQAEESVDELGSPAKRVFTKDSKRMSARRVLQKGEEKKKREFVKIHAVETTGQIPEESVPTRRNFARDAPQPTSSPSRRKFIRDSENSEPSQPSATTATVPSSAGEEIPTRRSFVRPTLPHQNPGDTESVPEPTVHSPEIAKREFRRDSSDTSGTRRRFRKPESDGDGGDEPAVVTHRDFKRQEEEARRQRTFKKESHDELKKREFKRVPMLTGLIDIDGPHIGTAGGDPGGGATVRTSVEELLLEKQKMDDRIREFDNRSAVFFNYVEKEQEKLTQAKTVLEEVAAKLDEERKLLAKDQAKVHYDRENLNIFKKQLDSQKEIQESLEEERQNYESEITSKNEEIQQLKAELEKQKHQLDDLKKEKEKEKDEFEREKQILLLSRGAQAAPDLDKERLQLATEKASFEKEKKEFAAIPVLPEGVAAADGVQVEELKNQCTLVNLNLEKEKKDTRQLKEELRKSKKENIKLMEQNKELLSTIASKDRRILNVERQIKKRILDLHAKYDKFFHEREDLLQERAALVELKLRLDEPPPMIPQDSPCWSDTTWLEEERQRLQKEGATVTAAKRFIEDERQRLTVERQKLEEDRTAFMKEKRALMVVPPVVVSLEVETSREREAALSVRDGGKMKSPSGKQGKRRAPTKGATISGKKSPPVVMPLPPSTPSPAGKKKRKGGRKTTVIKRPIGKDGEVEEKHSTKEERPLQSSGWGIRPRGDSEVPKDGSLSSRRARGVSASLAALHREEEKPKKILVLSKERVLEKPEMPEIQEADSSIHVESEEISETSDERPLHSTTPATVPTEVEELEFNDEDPFAIGKKNPLTMSFLEIGKRVEMTEEYLNTLVFDQEKELHSGHLAGLLLHLCRDDNDEFTVSFLLTMDYVIRPDSLLRILILLYRTPRAPLTAGGTRKDLTGHKSRVVDILNTWISVRFESLHVHDKWGRLFETFLEFLKTDNQEFATVLSQTWQTIISQTEEHKEKILELTIQTPNNIPNNLSFLAISPVHLACQITLVEQMYFQKVNIEEFYGKAWDYGEEKAPNLSKLLERFGEMCYWVSTEVVLSTGPDGRPSAKHRAQTISKFIRTMRELVLINNFNSLMQIYTGLNLPVVNRLQKTWGLVPAADKEIMNKVADLMDHRNNYRNYRQNLDLITETSCIPFISLLLRDLTFMEEDANYVNGDHVNFQKMILLSKIYAQLQDWHGQLYLLEEETSVQVYLKNKLVKTQEDLERIVVELKEDSPLSNENLFVDSDQLGEDLLGELDKFDICMPPLQDLLTTPDIYQSFSDWLNANDYGSDLNCLECLQAMYDFKKQNSPANTREELANEIFEFYLQPGAAKFIGEINEEILEELKEQLSSSSLIEASLFDEIMSGCASRLEEPWILFNNAGSE